MKVMVVRHPILARSFEVLFAQDNSDEYVSLDGSHLSYFISVGWVSNPPIVYTSGDITPLRIMGKTLEEKIKLLHYHVRFKDEEKYLNHYWKIANKLVNIQLDTEEDLDLPEVVILLANTPRRLLNHSGK